MGTVQFYSALALFLFCYFDGGNEVLASKDDGINAKDKIEEDLKLRIKVLKNEIYSLLRTKRKLKKALLECLDHNQLIRKSSDPLDFLCVITPEGCDYSGKIDDDPNDDGHLDKHGDKEESYDKLRGKIRELEARKEQFEKDVKWLKDHLDECKETTKTSKTTLTTTPEPTTTTPEPTTTTPKPTTTTPEPTTTTPEPTTTTTPEPKHKKYIIRTKKVSWYEAVRLCTNEQKQIATIASKSDQAALGQARKDQGVPNGQIWVGGRRNSPSDQFFWKGQNPTAFTYTNWHSTEPSHWSDDDQNCVESSWESNQYMWFVYECATEYNYACEYY